MKAKTKPYISYFQRVITLGVMNCAKNAKEARKIAKDRLSCSDTFLTDLNYCAFDETPFKHSLTEEWKTKMKIRKEPEFVEESLKLSPNKYV